QAPVRGSLLHGAVVEPLNVTALSLLIVVFTFAVDHAFSVPALSLDCDPDSRRLVRRDELGMWLRVLLVHEELDLAPEPREDRGDGDLVPRTLVLVVRTETPNEAFGQP